MRGCRAWAVYLVATAVLPVLLLQPALAYYDLAGMGGYDGFAALAMMQEHGVWAEADGTTAVYRLYEAASLLWLLSLLNVPLAVGLGVRSLVRATRSARL